MPLGKLSVVKPPLDRVHHTQMPAIHTLVRRVAFHHHVQRVGPLGLQDDGPTQRNSLCGVVPVIFDNVGLAVEVDDFRVCGPSLHEQQFIDSQGRALFARPAEIDPSEDDLAGD